MGYKISAMGRKIKTEKWTLGCGGGGQFASLNKMVRVVLDKRHLSTGLKGRREGAVQTSERRAFWVEDTLRANALR